LKAENRLTWRGKMLSLYGAFCTSRKSVYYNKKRGRVLDGEQEPKLLESDEETKRRIW